MTSVAQAMREAGIACKTVACFLELQIGLMVQPDFAKLNVEPFSFCGPVRQGGREGPFGFNIVLRWVFHALHEGGLRTTDAVGLTLEAEPSRTSHGVTTCFCLLTREKNSEA